MRLCIIQARLGSTRLPGKALKKIQHIPLLLHHFNRISKSNLADRFLVAIPDGAEDHPLAKFCTENNLPFFRGPELDVLQRFNMAAGSIQPFPQTIIRTTADCPLHHGEVLDFCIRRFMETGVDYFSNSNQDPVLEDGWDTEVFTGEALRKAAEHARLNSQREHVTPFIKDSGLFRCGYEKFSPEGPFKLSVDNQEDLNAVSEIFAHFNPRMDFTIAEIIRFLHLHPEILKLNAGSIINEGLKKTMAAEKKGQPPIT